VRGATRSGCTVSGESLAGRRRVRNKVWFCDATDLASLPATPQAVALNLAELVEKQQSYRAPAHRCDRAAPQLYVLPSPTADPIVREIFKIKDRDGS